MRPERADFKPEKADLRSERAELRPEKANLSNLRQGVLTRGLEELGGVVGGQKTEDGET